MSQIPLNLQKLYSELERLKSSGEDVVAEIRAEINNLELQYLKEQVIPEAARALAKKISGLRCEIDFSLQFNGDNKIDYSLFTSGSSVLIRENIDCSEPDCQDKTEEPTTNIYPSNRKSNNETVKPSDSLQIVPYSEKSFAVYGDTKPYSEYFKNHGGYFNPYLRDGAGWIFSKRRENEIRQFIGLPSVSDNEETDIIKPYHSLEIKPYSEKSFAVYGDIKPYSKYFKSLGGYFNIHVRDGAGWIFPNERKNEIRQFIGLQPEPNPPVSNQTVLSNEKTETVNHNKPKFSIDNFKEYLMRTETTLGGNYSLSTINVYVRSLKSAYMTRMVQKYDPSGDILEVSDHKILKQIYGDVLKDTKTKTASMFYADALKLYIKFSLEVTKGNATSPSSKKTINLTTQSKYKKSDTTRTHHYQGKLKRVITPDFSLSDETPSDMIM